MLCHSSYLAQTRCDISTCCDAVRRKLITALGGIAAGWEETEWEWVGGGAHTEKCLHKKLCRRLRPVGWCVCGISAAELNVRLALHFAFCFLSCFKVSERVAVNRGGLWYVVICLRSYSSQWQHVHDLSAAIFCPRNMCFEPITSASAIISCFCDLIFYLIFFSLTFTSFTWMPVCPSWLVWDKNNNQD